MKFDIQVNVTPLTKTQSQIAERSHYEPDKIIINFDENFNRYRYHAMAASDLSAHGKQPYIFKRYTGSYLRRMYDIYLVGFI